MTGYTAIHAETGEVLNRLPTETERQRELAAVARAGGRALTQKLVARWDVLQSIAWAPADVVDERWRYSIDPATSTGSQQQRRDAWRDIAEDIAGGAGNPTYMGSSHPMVYLPHAEAMVGWPIYRAAFAYPANPQVVVAVSGGNANAFVTRGEVDLVEVDWDRYEQGGVLDYQREDLDAKRDELLRIADPYLRAELLADMDEVIADWESSRPDAPMGEDDRHDLGLCPDCGADLTVREPHADDCPLGPKHFTPAERAAMVAEGLADIEKAGDQPSSTSDLTKVIDDIIYDRTTLDREWTGNLAKAVVDAIEKEARS